MGQNFRTIQVTKSSLREALRENLYWKKAKIVPFSKNKARWLLQNSRIDENDLCAVLGYENEELISFVYMIPDWLKTKEGIKKIYWCRRWWVADQYKDTILATYTLNEAITTVNNQVLIKFLGRDVVEFYKKQPYINFYSRTRYIILFNIDAAMLSNKIKILKSFKSILKPIENFSSYGVNWINKRKIKDNIQGLNYEYVSKIDKPIWNFLANFCEQDIIPKSQEYINWQLSSEQYMSTTIFEKYPYNDLVASISHKIYPITFSIIENDEIIGFTSTLVRGNEFEVKYFIASEEHYEKCMDALLHNFIKVGANTFLTENENLGKRILKKYQTIFYNQRKLDALAHKELDFDVTDMKVYDRDGHFA